MVFTGPESARDYFTQIDRFIGDTLGVAAQGHYRIIIDDPAEVARTMESGIRTVREFRKAHGDAYYFNWLLKIDHAFQHPFEPTHANMHQLSLHKNQEPHVLAAQLRRAFSGIVAGNVKDSGVRAIEQHGPFDLQGEPAMMASMDALLTAFVQQHRMKLPGKAYVPCYRILR